MGCPEPRPLYVLESAPARRKIAVAPPRSRALGALLIFVLPAALFAGLAYWSLRTQSGGPKRNRRPRVRAAT